MDKHLLLRLPFELKCEILKFPHTYTDIIEQLKVSKGQLELNNLLGCVRQIVRDPNKYENFTVQQLQAFPNLERVEIPFILNYGDKDAIIKISTNPNLVSFIIEGHVNNLELITLFFKSKPQVNINNVQILLRTTYDLVYIDGINLLVEHLKTTTIPIIRILQEHGGAKNLFISYWVSFDLASYTDIYFDKIAIYKTYPFATVRAKHLYAENYFFSNTALVILYNLDKNTSNIEFRVILDNKDDEKHIRQVIEKDFSVNHRNVSTNVSETNFVFNIVNEDDLIDLTRTCPNIKTYHIKLLSNVQLIDQITLLDSKIKGRYKLISFFPHSPHPLIEVFKLKFKFKPIIMSKKSSSLPTKFLLGRVFILIQIHIVIITL